MEFSLPNAKSSPSPDDRERLRRIVVERNLCGLANDTKWDEFLTAMRGWKDWRPRYRWKSIAGPPSTWDVEWFYHLPFPFLSVEWFDVSFHQELREHRLPPRVHQLDHSPRLEALLQLIGLEFLKGQTMIRIFGYSPKDLDLFDS